MDCEGAPPAYDDSVQKVQGAIYYTYWGVITRRVCLGGGPAAAAVWQGCVAKLVKSNVNNCAISN